MPDFNEIKCLVESVEATGIISEISNMVFIDDRNVLVADCSHNNFKGKVLHMMKSSKKVNNLDFDVWVADREIDPPGEDMTHFGKNIATEDGIAYIGHDDRPDYVYLVNVESYVLSEEYHEEVNFRIE